MPIDETALLAAVDKGIADAAPAAPAAAPATTDEGNDNGGEAGGDSGAAEIQGAAPADAGGDGSGAVVEGDGAAAEGADAEKPTDGVEGTANPVLGPDGKPVAPAGAKVEQPPVKEPDPLNDPLPNALKPETKKRIHTLVDMVKTTSKERDDSRADLEALMNPILETKATPQQYRQTLNYLQLVNSPSREDKEKALEMLQGDLKALATMLGKPIPGVNFLEGHQDLIDAVGTGKITHQHAMELAAARAAQGYQKTVEQRVNEGQQASEAQAQAREQGRQDLNALGRQLQSDPNYAYKRGVLGAQLKEIFKDVHPTRWAAAFKAAYDALPVPQRTAPPPPPPPNIPANTPLRANNPAGGQQKAPSSLAEAIDFGISSAGR